MIPYIHFERAFQLLHLPIQPFGLLVVIAVWVGSVVTLKRGRELGLDARQTGAMFMFSIVVGFVTAHVFDLVAYQSAGQAPSLLTIINPFAGLSSYGGMGGTLLGMYGWCKWHRQPFLPYVDASAFGLAPGWVFGRIGCFTAHDHPGRLTNFVLAVRYPDGPRHDLGLYEVFFALGLTLLFARLARRKQRLGVYPMLICLLYAPVRFFLDFLRATDVPGADPRYYGMTPGQYASIVVFAVGLMLLRPPGDAGDAHAPA